MSKTSQRIASWKREMQEAYEHGKNHASTSTDAHPYSFEYYDDRLQNQYKLGFIHERRTYGIPFIDNKGETSYYGRILTRNT